MSGGRAAPWLLLGGLVTLVWLEHRRPLRQRTAPQGERLADNAATGAKAALVVACLEAPVTHWATRKVEREHLGLLPKLGLPAAGERALGLLLLDYTLYLWHILLHRAPALWRWHQVHHADPDLDVSTALRFHAVEMVWSLPWRLAQILLIGVRPGTLALWAPLTLAEVMFHHANLRLPLRAERLLGLLLTTPRMHGIHHSNVARHQHANFSSGLAVWDVLHGTARRDVAQETITIGLPIDDPLALER